MMAKAVVQPRLEQAGIWEQTFRDGDRELLRAKAQWPRLEAQYPGLRRIDRYYAHLSILWRRRWEGTLLTQARTQGTGGRPWSASFTYEITLLTPALFSLWWEVKEDLNKDRPRQIRHGDIWAIPQGTPVGPQELFAPLGRSWKNAVLEAVKEQIQNRLQSGEFLFKENWPQTLRQYLSEDGFYLTSEGPVLFYPIETIAPALEGFPSFSLSSLLPQETSEPSVSQSES